MPPQISLHELYRMQKEKTNARIICFDRVLELCHRRIRTVASYGGQNTFFEVPGMMIGYPLYNIHECMDYVVDSLRKTGFLVQILPPPNVCVLYVSWDPKELRPNMHKVKKNTRPAIQAPPPSRPLLRLF